VSGARITAPRDDGPILHTGGVSDPHADRDLQIQIARLEHALGRVADEGAEPDDQVVAAEQVAQIAADAGGSFDRLVRESGGR
jgi:hypothetical protein